MIGKEAENKLNLLSLPENTVQRRISILSKTSRISSLVETLMKI